LQATSVSYCFRSSAPKELLTAITVPPATDAARDGPSSRTGEKEAPFFDAVPHAATAKRQLNFIIIEQMKNNDPEIDFDWLMC